MTDLNHDQIERLAETLHTACCRFDPDGRPKRSPMNRPYSEQREARKKALRQAVVEVVAKYESMRQP